MKYRNWFALLLFLLLPELSYTQELNGARLALLYGGNITFNFNSISKFANGMELINATQLGITLADSNQPGYDLEGFDLNIRSFNGSVNIKGDIYTLPLDKIRLKAENALGLGAGTSFGYQDLTTGWTTLFSYTNPAFTNLTWNSSQLYISYDCGIPISAGGNGTLLGQPADYYSVEIEIELIPTGPGF
jgi:hypothetical protein